MYGKYRTTGRPESLEAAKQQGPEMQRIGFLVASLNAVQTGSPARNAIVTFITNLCTRFAGDSSFKTRFQVNEVAAPEVLAPEVLLNQNNVDFQLSFSVFTNIELNLGGPPVNPISSTGVILGTVFWDEPYASNPPLGKNPIPVKLMRVRFFTVANETKHGNDVAAFIAVSSRVPEFPDFMIRPN